MRRLVCNVALVVSERGLCRALVERVDLVVDQVARQVVKLDCLRSERHEGRKFYFAAFAR